MLIDAAVLAGGRSLRLGSVAKASLTLEGQSLLNLTVSAATSVSRRCVIVGPSEPDTSAGTPTSHRVVDGLPAKHTVLTTRENPPFSGPAAALSAGVTRLASEGGPSSDALLVLACDMPGIAAQVPVLVASLTLAPGEVDGVISIDAGGRRQPLAALYRSAALESALARFTPDQLLGLSMRELIDPLHLVSVMEVPGATEDVDTWADAARLGVVESARDKNASQDSAIRK